MRIFAQKNGSYTKGELLDLATLLIKGGYTVRRGKTKIDGKPVEIVEFFAAAPAGGDDADGAET